MHEEGKGRKLSSLGRIQVEADDARYESHASLVAIYGTLSENGSPSVRVRDTTSSPPRLPSLSLSLSRQETASTNTSKRWDVQVAKAKSSPVTVSPLVCQFVSPRLKLVISCTLVIQINVSVLTRNSLKTPGKSSVRSDLSRITSHDGMVLRTQAKASLQTALKAVY
jgi:hypothetical protein